MTLFRHKKSDIFMCISFVIAFFLVFVVLSYMNKIKSASEDMEIHTYMSQCRLIFAPSEKPDIDKIIENADGLHGIIIAEEVGMAVDAAAGEYYTSVVLYADERYKIVEDGKVKTIDLSGDLEAVIGESFEKYLIDGNQISLDGQLYNVVAVDESDEGSDYSFSILTRKEGLSEYTETKMVNSEAISIKILSDKYNTSDSFAALRESILELYPESRVYAEELSGEILYSEDAGYMEFYIMVYLFCVINCMVAAQFWVMERKREMAIRKAYGYGSCRLFTTIYLEFTKVAMFGMLCCLVIKWVSDLFMNNRIFAFELTVFNAMFLVGAVLITSLVSILLPIYTISKASSVDQIIKKG